MGCKTDWNYSSKRKKMPYVYNWVDKLQNIYCGYFSGLALWIISIFLPLRSRTGKAETFFLSLSVLSSFLLHLCYFHDNSRGRKHFRVSPPAQNCSERKPLIHLGKHPFTTSQSQTRRLGTVSTVNRPVFKAGFGRWISAPWFTQLPNPISLRRPPAIQNAYPHQSVIPA